MYSGTAIAVLVYLHCITLQQNTTQRQQWQCWSIHNTSHCSRTSRRNSNGSFSLSMTHSIAAEHHTEKQWQYWSIHTPYFSRTLHRDSNGSFGLSTIHCTAGEHTETAVLVYPQYTVLQENITHRQQYWSIHNTLYCRRTSHRDSSIGLSTIHCSRTSHRDSSTGLSTIHCSRTSHRDRNGSITISLSTTHCTYSQDLLQQNITQRDSNGRINLYI